MEKIICCRMYKGERQALAKWNGYAKPEWTSLTNLQDTIALDEWESKYGSAESNNGPSTTKKTPPKRSGRKGRG